MTEVVFSPVESSLEGYYRVPGFSDYAINKNGVVVDLLSGEIMPTHRSTGYVYTCIHPDSSDAAISIGIHRLLASAFYGPPPTKSAIPNHIDGVKDNNVSSNIEWSTYSKNIDHAYRNGLRTDNRPVLAKNLITGEIMRFHAMAECARYFEVPTERIWRNLRSNVGNIYFGNFLFKFEDDTSDWPPLTAADVGKPNNGDSKETLAYHIESKAIYIAPSISAMSVVTGVKMPTIAYALRTGKQYPINGYLFKYRKDPTPWSLDAAALPTRNSRAK